MTRTVTSIGPPVMLSRVRLQGCADDGCARKSRMAIVVPLSDIGEDGGPGLGCLVFCSDHIEDALVRLTRALTKEDR